MVAKQMSTEESKPDPIPDSPLVSLPMDKSFRVLITGGSGFIGTNLVEAYKTQGCRVLSIDKRPPRNPAHSGLWLQVDIMDRARLESAVRDFDPDYIFHLAARTDLDGATVEDYAENFTGTENLIEAASALQKLRRIIFASTRLVCRIGYQPKSDTDYCPTTPYGESKIRMEIMLRQSARIPCSWAMVRPTSIWGPWFDVPYKTFFTTIARGYYFHPGTTRVRKSFGFAGNTVFQLQRLSLAQQECVQGRMFYLADYEPIEVHEMAGLIQKTMGVREIRTVPIPLLRAAAVAGDMARKLGWRNPPLTSFRLDNLLTNMVHDLEPLRQVAGPLPYSWQEGVTATVAWMRETGEL